MSYQSPDCYYNLCDKCDTKDCTCRCHSVGGKHNGRVSNVVEPYRPIRPKSTLIKRRNRLIKDLGLEQDNKEETIC